MVNWYQVSISNRFRDIFVDVSVGLLAHGRASHRLFAHAGHDSLVITNVVS